MMTEEQLQRAKEIYETAAERDPSEWGALLDEACRDDQELRAEVEELLSFLPQSGDFIERPPLADPSLFDSIAQSLSAGRRIGTYRVLEEIGRGGMGAVYLAVRADDEFSKQVAIKLVWPGFDSAEVIKRFRQERQILANLDHPNIARLLDGGTTEEGWPYVVMEYVNGVPITDYCNKNQLSIAERLKLFQQVCAAVAYAHRNLVVHRDLKPGNIFVTRDGSVKLLDFGIAKILDPALRPDALSLTHTGVYAMTPEYASPEQARGENITTASDVYSLGVTLYELLTGVHPFRFKTRALHEMLRVICEDEPARPSLVCSTGFRARVSSPTVRESEVAKSTPSLTVGLPPEGGTTNFLSAQEDNPDKLRRRLQGDLDNIILKAVCKEPERRYASVEQLSEDIRRHLSGEPVLAQKPTLSYRANKFARRNKAWVAFAAFVVVTLIGGLIVAIRQAQQAREQARENRRVTYAAQMNQAAQDREDANVGRIREAVESYPPKKGEEDLRGFEWYYLWRWINRDLVTLPHSEWIAQILFLNNEREIMTADASKKVRLWDAQTGRLIKILPVEIDPDSMLQGINPLSVNGVEIVYEKSDDRTIRIRELLTGRVILTIVDPASAIRSVAFVHGWPTFFTGSENGTIRAWDWATGREVYSLKNSALPINRIEIWPELPRLLAQVGDRQIELWDVARRSLVVALKEPSPVRINLGAPRSFDLYAKGQHLRLLDMVTGRERATIKLGDSESDITWGAYDKKLFTTGQSQVIKVWDTDTGRKIAELTGHSEWIYARCVSSDGRLLASASGDRTVRLWDMQTLRPLAVIPAHENEVHNVGFSVNGVKLATSGADYTVKIWDVASLLAPDVLESHTDWVFSIAFSPDNSRLATTGQDRTVKLWETATGKLLNTFNRHEGEFFAVAWSPDGERLATASADKTVKILEANTGGELVTLSDFNTRVRSVAFSRDGKTLVTGSDYRANPGIMDDRTLRVWDAATGRELMTLRGHAGDVVSVAYSPDGNLLASASWDRTVRLWDARTGRELATLRGHSEPVWSVRFSPDGKRLATGSYDQTIKLWDVATGQELMTLKGHSNEVFSVDFSPDGKRLASASNDKTVRLWDAATGRELITFKDHKDQVWSVAFSPNGLTLASGSWDRTARLWRAASEEEVRAKLARRNQ
jgi:WD40 repeat protein/serine/threonine protein kinase